MDLQSLGYRIWVCRALRGLSMRQLALLVGVNDSTICRYERGLIGRPRMPLLLAIADALEVSFPWIMGALGVPACADAAEAEWVERTLAEVSEWVEPVGYRRRLG